MTAPSNNRRPGPVLGRRTPGVTLGRDGQAVLEAAMVVPLLLTLLLMVIEAGNGLSIKHRMTVLSREGANIASRGSTLPESLDAVMLGGGDILLSELGGAIVTRIVVEDGEPVIEGQSAAVGYEGRSRLGLPDSLASSLQPLALAEGQVLHAVELFLDYRPITPVGSVLPGGVVDEIYDRAIF